MAERRGPLQPLRDIISSTQRDLSLQLDHAAKNVQKSIMEAQKGLSCALQQLGHGITQQQRQRQGKLSRLASLTLSRQTLLPCFELALNHGDIKARLAGVPVFTVANRDNSEFVLVSGSGEELSEPRQLGFFFFKESDAAAMIAKIQEQSPDLAKQSHVMRLTLDKVYEFTLSPKKDTPAEGVVFRFMPDADQVMHALKLYKEAGIKWQSFVGVPVFQAEGLTVKTEKSRYTPLFFSKEDLDAAVGNAYTHKEQHREATNKAHAVRADADLAAAQNKYDSADNEARNEAKESLNKARAKSDKYKGRVEEGSKPEPPKVEVGCLEEVLLKMQQADGKGDWGSVMFVPAGAISVPQKKRISK